MGDEPKNRKTNAKDISRRGLLGTAALVVGAATSAMAARTALAKATDISLDSQGRVVMDGTLVREAANKKNTGGATGSKKMDSHNERCTNAGCAAQPAAATSNKPKSPQKNMKKKP
jgi:hypothetical protein